MRRVGWWSVAVMVAVVGLVHAVEAQRSTAVAIGETAAPEAIVGEHLRAALSEELGAVHGVRVTPTRSAHYVLRGAVTRLEVEGESDRRRLECEVSLIVADRRGGSVRMVLSGRASARGPGVERLQSQVVRAAVRGALRPLGPQLAR
ncbi:MAG: hypothetical protein KF901_18305 [Myxococcales bacterium]|nr:hypothetical protein [Myxococcales bacterium]